MKSNFTKFFHFANSWWNKANFIFTKFLSNFPAKFEENCCFSWFIEVHNTRLNSKRKAKREILTYLRRNVIFEFGARFTRSAESLQRRRNQTQHPYGGKSQGVKLNSRKNKIGTSFHEKNSCFLTLWQQNNENWNPSQPFSIWNPAKHLIFEALFCKYCVWTIRKVSGKK